MNAAPKAAAQDGAYPAPKQVIPGNAIAERLMAAGQRPLVLGAVAVTSDEAFADGLFEALAHVSNGADGIDLTLPPSLTPGERLAAADQLAEATGAAMYLRTDVPMACGEHTLIVSAAAGRLRASLKVMYDAGWGGASGDSSELGVAWPALDEARSMVVSTAGIAGLSDAGLSDAGLMGLASAASERGVAALSTDRVRIVRRVVDTLAPLYSNAQNAGEAPCR